MIERLGRLLVAGSATGRRASIALVARIVAGLVLVVFGAAKFADHAAEVESFRSYGLPSPDAFVYTIGALELFGGALLIVGLATRIAALVLAGNMAGRALSGPLHDARVKLAQTTVVASSWGAWKRAHPLTRIVVRDGGISRDYPSDPLRGRDDGGPIFPIGPADPRLPVAERVIGVIARDGTAVTFSSEQARAALADGRGVSLRGVRLLGDGSGLRAVNRAGRALVAHEAFWFAWSQFNQTTAVWTP